MTWKELTAALIFALVVGALLVRVPIGTTYQFGADEGYEVMKAFLVHEGWQLYEPIWSDQPPLFTFLLAGSFELFGVSIFIARFVVVHFTGLLLKSLWWILARHAGPFAAVIGPALLALWPDFLKFGVSVMQIVPMMAMGLFGMALFCRALERDRLPGFLAAGAAFGLGLGIKFTNALFFPALAILWLVHLKGKPHEDRRRHWLHGSATAGAGCVVLMVILLLIPALSFETLLRPHFSPTTYREASASPPGELLHLLTPPWDRKHFAGLRWEVGVYLCYGKETRRRSKGGETKSTRRAKRCGASIFFLDEAGFQSDPPLGRTYGQKGKTPEVKTGTTSKHQRYKRHQRPRGILVNYLYRKA